MSSTMLRLVSSQKHYWTTVFFFFSLQQLLKMREELKQREAELEKSLEDKQQLGNQVQNLKDGLQYLQNTHVMQVRFTGSTVLSAGFPEIEERMLIYNVFCGCVL